MEVVEFFQLLLKLVVIIAVPLGWGLFLFAASIKLKPWMHKLFDRWWKPGKNVAYLYEPAPDEELEMVIESAPEVVIKISVGQLLLLAFVIGASLATLVYAGVSGWDQLQDLYVKQPWMKWEYLAYMAVSFMLPFAIVPFGYWLSTWKISKYRLVVFTKVAWLVHVKVFPWSMIIPFYKGIRYKLTDSLTILLEEAILVTDTELLVRVRKQLEIRTGPLTDIIVGYYAEELGVGSLHLVSRIFGGDDLFENLAWAFNTRQILKHEIIDKKARVLTRASQKVIDQIIDLRLKGGPEVRSQVRKVEGSYARAFHVVAGGAMAKLGTESSRAVNLLDVGIDEGNFNLDARKNYVRRPEAEYVEPISDEDVVASLDS
jgi:hypothetical protein